MTVEEILTAVSEKYPHSYDTVNIISKINMVQAELFRTLYRPETASFIDLISDNPFYVVTFDPGNIISVVVNGQEYPRSNIKNNVAPSFFWYVLDNDTIGIYPTPTMDIQDGITVFRYVEPKRLTVDNLESSPDFDSAWHPIIVYRVCKELAESANDADMVNVFVSQINGYEDEYKRTKYYQPYKIENVWGGIC